jgi:hypothetical protein
LENQRESGTEFNGATIMNSTIHNDVTIENTTHRRSSISGNRAADGEQQTRKPSRFRWLLDESVFQAFLLVAVLVALVDGLSSVNHIPFV